MMHENTYAQQLHVQCLQASASWRLLFKGVRAHPDVPVKEA